MKIVQIQDSHKLKIYT